MIVITEDWVLGFTWGVGTISSHRLFIRYHDVELLAEIAEVLRTKAKPYHPTEGKTALRFSLKHPFAQRLMSLGWSGRLDKERKYPRGLFDEIEFIRGYCHTKATLDVVRPKGVPTPRLRIYGSLDIVTKIDNFLAARFGLKPKKPQLCNGESGTCYAIYYQSKRDVPQIVELLQINKGRDK